MGRLAAARPLHLSFVLGRRRGVGRVGNRENALVGAGACIREARLDLKIGIVAHLGQIVANRRLHLAGEVILLYVLLNVFERRYSALGVVLHLKDYEALF